MKLPDIGAGRQVSGGTSMVTLANVGTSVLSWCAWLEAGLSIPVYLSDFLVSTCSRSTAAKCDNRLLWGTA